MTRIHLKLLGLGLCLASVSQPTYAGVTTSGSEYPLLGNVQGHQQNPAMAVGANGGFVVWQNATAESGGERVVAQRLGADLKGLGSAFRVSQNVVGQHEENPAAALMADGGLVAAWEGGPRANKDVYVRFANERGGFITGDTVANSHRAGNQHSPAVAVLADGSALVVWSSDKQDGSGSGVFGQRFTAQGVRMGTEFLVNQTTMYNQLDPAVAALSSGGFVVAWVSETATGRTSIGAVNLRGNLMGRLFGANGSPAGNEYQLNEGDELTSAPSLAPKGTGFVAAWVEKDEANPKNSSDIAVRSFSSAGVPAGKEEILNTYRTGAQRDPVVVSLGDDALVAWTSMGQDGSGAGVQARLVSGGREWKVNTQTRLHQSTPALGVDGSGRILASWVNTVRSDHSILAGQVYSTQSSTGTDLTAGEVKVHSAANTARRSVPSVASEAQKSAQARALAEKARMAKVAAQQRASASATARIKATPKAAPTETPDSASPPSVASVPSAPATPPSAVSESAAVSQARTAANRASLSRPTRMSTRPTIDRARYNVASAARNALTRRAQSASYASRNAAAQRSSGGWGTRTPTAGYTRTSTRTAMTAPQRTTSMRTPYARPSTRQSSYNPWAVQSSRATSSRFGASTASRAPTMASRVSTRNAGAYNARTPYTTRTAAQQTRTAAQQFASARATASRRTAASAPNSGAVQANLVNDGRGYRVQWNGDQGGIYQVQRSSDQSKWQNVGAPRWGRGAADSLRIRSSNTPQHYRVVRRR